jgi:ADP-ribose pyrophosphatase
LERSPPGFRIAFSTPWFEIEETVPANPSEAPYYRMTGPDGIICLPFTPAGDIVMIRQYRPSLEADTLEIPAGAIEKNEAPMVAARREVLEETGWQCGLLYPLGTGRLYLNRCTQREHLVLGLDAVPVPGTQAEAGITLSIVSRAEFHAMVQRDEIEQTVILSFLGLASAKLGIDLIRDPIENIRRRIQDCASGR